MDDKPKPYTLSDEIKVSNLYRAKGTAMLIQDGEGHLTREATERFTAEEAMSRVARKRGLAAARGLILRTKRLSYEKIAERTKRSATSSRRDWREVLDIFFADKVARRET